MTYLSSSHMKKGFGKIMTVKVHMKEPY